MNITDTKKVLHYHMKLRLVFRYRHIYRLVCVNIR